MRLRQRPGTARRWIIVVGAAAAAVTGTAGCNREDDPPLPFEVGGDSPVTAERLAGARLEAIGRGDATVWEFGPERVVITAGRGPLPADLAALPPARAGGGAAADAAPDRVDAAWRLDAVAGVLVLSDFRPPAGAESGGDAGERRVPIEPAGHVRVNLGERQYNLFPAAWLKQLAPTRPQG